VTNHLRSTRPVADGWQPASARIANAIDDEHANDPIVSAEAVWNGKETIAVDVPSFTVIRHRLHFFNEVCWSCHGPPQ